LLGLANPIIFLPMSRSYARPAPHLRLTKVYRRPDMSIDDIRFKLLERDRLAALDDRSEAAKWLGDPPPWRRCAGAKKTIYPAR
jgi:hypothetical protein